MNTYTTTNYVHYYEINSQRQASPVTVLNYIEESAVRLSEACGYGSGRLMDKGLIWILTYWSVRMNRYPVWMENVLVETRVLKFERFYAFREFTISNENNSTLGSAVSRWILYDIHRNRPVRVPSEIAEAFKVNCGKDNQGNSIILPEVEVAETYEPGLEFRVRLSDIDTYNHVNNTRYVEWMLEAVPFEIHQEFYPASLEISYRKETVYGAYVLSEARQEPEVSGTIKIYHRIRDKAAGAELARAVTVWKKVQHPPGVQPLQQN